MKRPYECKVNGCDKSYTTRFSLRRHVASHSAIKQHVCVLCFKTFTLAQYLKEHTYIHTQQKPFKCDFAGCTRAFRQAGKLSMHRKVHQNIIFAIQRVKRRPLGELIESAPVEDVTPNKLIQWNDYPQQNQEEQKDEANSAVNSNRVTIPHRVEDPYEMGENTENELSLSREDDSDLSRRENSLEPGEEMKQDSDAEDNEADQQVQEPELPGYHSESIEDSIMEESDFDENYLRREERAKVAFMLEKKDKSQMVTKFHKAKAPYEMLIRKLIDGLQRPTMISDKQLPDPIEGYTPANNIKKQNLPKIAPVDEDDEPKKLTKEAAQPFAEIYKTLPTSADTQFQPPLLSDSQLESQKDVQEQAELAIAEKEKLAEPAASEEAKDVAEELVNKTPADESQQLAVSETVAELAKPFPTVVKSVLEPVMQPMLQQPMMQQPAMQQPMLMQVPQNQFAVCGGQQQIQHVKMMPMQTPYLQAAPQYMQQHQPPMFYQMPQMHIQAPQMMRPGPQTLSFIQLVPMQVQMQPLQGIQMQPNMMMSMPSPYM